MRAKLSIVLGIAMLLIEEMPGLRQYPQGGGNGGGGYGGGYGGGGKGGRGRGFDPSMAQFRGGKMGGRWAAMMSGVAPEGGKGGPAATDWADNYFRRLDQNQDGVLNNDEMPETLRAELDKWDTDKNGLIDLNEFKAWFQARMQQLMADRKAPDGQGLGVLGLAPGSEQPEGETRKPPVVYRVGNLPKELAAWVSEYDTDQDAQIGLYEWKATGRPIEEFNKIDRNGDGFLTVDEVLRYEASQGRGPQTPAAGGGASGSFAAPGLDAGGAGNPAWGGQSWQGNPAGFGRQNWQPGAGGGDRPGRGNKGKSG